MFATLRFFENPQYHGKKSKWISCHKGFVVFPNEHLDSLISAQELAGQSLSVFLEKRSNLDNKNSRYVAYANDKEDLVLSSPELIGRKVFVLIDGQNFLGAINAIEKRTDRHLSPYETVKEIMGNYKCLSTKFFFSLSKARGFLSLGEFEQFEKDPDIIIDNFDPKKINVDSVNGKVAFDKSDIDHLVVPEIFLPLLSGEQLDGLVLFSGDSHYGVALEMFLGKGQFGAVSQRFGQKMVNIVSSHDTISSELRDIGNLPEANIIFLEDLLLEKEMCLTRQSVEAYSFA